MAEISKSKKRCEISPEGECFSSLQEWLSDTPLSDLAEVQAFMASFKPNDFSDKFRMRCLLSMVITANKLERTLPAGCSKQNTDKILGDLYAKIMAQGFETLLDMAPEHVWNADGETQNGRPDKHQLEHQLQQHLLASLFLERADKMDVDTIVRCHTIMMRGAVDDDNKLLVPGFRTQAAHAGDGHVYLEPEAISASLGRTLEQYEEYVKEKKFFLAAASLFYNVITIHPFANGNGRLCRLLLATSLCKNGFPFMITFSTGHTRAHSHYMHAIKSARRSGVMPVRLAELAAIALMSAVHVMDNYQENFAL